MKYIFTLLILCLISLNYVQAQSLEELKTMQSEKLASIEDLQSQIDGINGELEGLQKEIDILSGWRKGINGLFGLDWNNSNGWVANPNPDSRATSLSIGITAFANADKEKTFWHNKGIVQKAWNDVDKSDGDRMAAGDGLFDNGTIDLLNISSLAGYKISETFAFSGLAELNTSVENFLKPGTFDIGVGATWLPIDNMTVVIHPFNYHFAWPSQAEKDKLEKGISSSGSFGAKVRVDYFKDFNIAGSSLTWTTTLTSFIPYSDTKQNVVDEMDVVLREAGLMEYTWINNLSFEVWNGIGVGVGFGLRNSNFESADLQSYTTLGLSYGF